MRVIGDRELRFRVNVRPTNRDFSQENYGFFHGLSAIPAGGMRTADAMPSLRDEIPGHRGPFRGHG
jgi:hypothetical protein